MGQKTNMWLKRIFSVSTLTTVATVVAACIAIIQYVESNGGKFVAFVNNEEAIPPIRNTILVYLDNDSVDLSQLGIFPTITNPSKCSLQDVLLTYRIDSKSSNISYSDYFSIHRVANGEQVTNIDKTLYAKTDMPEPFYYFVIRNNGEASIDIRATYKGVETPFTYHADLYAKKLNLNDSNTRKKAIFDDARNLASNKNLKTFDIFVIDNDKIETYRNIEISRMAAVESTPVIKTSKQIKSENQELIKDSQNKQKTPWFMYVVGGALLLVIFIGFTADLMIVISFMDYGINNRIKVSLGYLISTFILWIGLYYFFILFDSNPIQKFWAGLVSLYILALYFPFLFLCTYKISSYFSIREENENWILLLLLPTFWPIIYLCIYVYNSIPY